MSITKLIKEEHKLVLDLIEEIQASSPRSGKTREKRYSKLKKALFKHMHAEETTFYPYLLKHTKKKDGLYEAFQEHRVVRLALPEVDMTDVNNEQWQPKFAVIAEMLKHHIEEEEDEVFKLADKILDKKSNSKLTDAFEDAKKRTIVI